MPLDVLGRTRATMTSSSRNSAYRPGESLNTCRDGARPLQLLVSNEEFLVSASHQLALITSLPFVHTARRTYRLNGPVNPTDGELRVFRKWSEPYHLEEGEVVTRFP